MTGKIKICECCGAKVQEYPHILNKQLAQALLKIYDKHGKKPVKISEILDHTAINNFQKLQHWGLVIKHSVGDDRKGGVWRITDSGEAFVRNIKSVPKKVWTLRNRLTKMERPMVKISQLESGYKNRPWYIDNSRPGY